jgi:hypothetical protein
LFEQIFSAPFNQNFSEKEFKAMGAGKVPGMKLVIDVHLVKKNIRTFFPKSPMLQQNKLECFPPGKLFTALKLNVSGLLNVR